MRHWMIAGCAALALAGCTVQDGGEGEGADQLDTADLDAREDAPAPATPAGDATGESRKDPAKTAERAMEEMAQPVACAQGEPTLFSCDAGRKQIAVCGVTDARGQPDVQYRCYCDTAEIVLSGGRFASVPYSGGGEAQIEFPKGATRYIVYSRTVRTNFEAGEPNNLEFTDGVLVVRGGKPIAERNCTGNVESVDINAAESYGGAESELFYYD